MNIKRENNLKNSNFKMGTMGVAKLIKKPTTLIFLGGLRVKNHKIFKIYIY